MKSWYKNNGNESVIFVPCTPEEKLKKAYEEEIKKSRFKIKIVEKSGKKLKDTLHKKDPFKSEKCGKIDCFVCTTNGKGNCRKENVTYTIRCMEECDKKDIYYGETSYNAYTRGGEHLHKYNSKDPKSIMFQHDNLVHEGRKCKYQMSVTGTFHNDSTKRQIAEGVNIEKIPRERLMNSKNEWNTPNMPACTVTRLKDR